MEIGDIISSMAADNMRDIERVQARDIGQDRRHFLGMLQQIETLVAPNRKGCTPRNAAKKVLELLMDDHLYMTAENVK